MSTQAIVRRRPRLGVFHCTFTGAAVLGVIFLLLTASEAIADAKASKAVLVLFTQQALRSPEAIADGLLTALIVGGLFGALVAIFFNLFGAIIRD